MATRSDTWIHLSLRLPRPAAEELGLKCVELGAPGVQTDEVDLRRRERGCEEGKRDGTHSRASRLEAYFPPQTNVRDLGRELRQTIARLKAIHGGPGPERVELRRVRLPDYTTTWKQHFKPIRIGRRLIVAAPWHEVAADGRLVIRIDPGQAFGTGQHPTTRACLLEIERICAEESPRSGLDLGCGSGVLAFAMRRLGVPTVVALDTDPAARAATMAGAGHNDCDGIRVGTDFGRLERRFDLIAANLFSRVLTDLAPTLEERLSANGHLIVSGLLARQEAEVQRAIVRTGLRIERRRVLSGWVTLTAVRSQGRRR